MEKVSPVKRLTETLPGRLAAVLLAVIWIASMAAVDSNAYSVWPFLVAVSLVVLLFISGMLWGGKTIRIPWLGWLFLVCGGYFLVRSLFSYAMVEAWLESSLIVSCCVFYVAGIYGAQSKSGKSTLAVVIVAVVLNLLYLWVRPGETDMLWTGRPEFGLSGHNRAPVTLFVYKNFACAFLMLGGGVLLGSALWLAVSRYMRCICVVLGVLAVYCSFLCSARVVFLLGPLFFCLLWLMQFLIELFTREKLRKLTIICSLLVAVAVCVEIGNLLGGNGFFQVTDIYSNGRFEMWKAVLAAGSAQSLFGNGTGAAHWDIITEFHSSVTPNMAHNEYLQVWVDYGVTGVAVMLCVIVVHALLGFRTLASDVVSPVRRGMAALTLCVLICLSVISFVDFYWHSYALAVMTAYCCGVLVSPVGKKIGADGGGAAVRTQSVWGHCVMGLLGVGIVGFVCWQHGNLSQAWLLQWKFSELDKSGTDQWYSERLDILERTMESYPAPEVADCYFMLPHYGGARSQSEYVLRRALVGNPRQGYILTMLVTILGQQNRYEEAELLMRRYYPQEGIPSSAGCNWPFFYYYNLLRRSIFLMNQGKQELGMSMAEYALNMQNPTVMRMSLMLRSKGEPWEKAWGIHPVAEVQKISKAANRRLKLLRKIGVQPDDSWMQPMEPGGKSALYPQLGIKAKKPENKSKIGK